MRDIKFRAWNKKLKKYHYFTGIFNKRPYTERSTFAQYDSSKEYHELIREQFIGLKDENCEALDWWEGDIVGFSYQHGFIGALQTETITAPITFEQGQYWIDGYPIQKAVDEYGIKIGNIHENSELSKD